MGNFVKISDTPEREIGNPDTGTTPDWVVAQGNKGRLVRIDAMAALNIGDVTGERAKRAQTVTEKDFQHHAGLRRTYGTYANYIYGVKTYSGFTPDELRDENLGTILNEQAKTAPLKNEGTPDEMAAAWQERENTGGYDTDSDTYKLYNAWQAGNERTKRLDNAVSESEFNRSQSMQEQYGTYDDYINVLSGTAPAKLNYYLLSLLPRSDFEEKSKYKSTANGKEVTYTPDGTLHIMEDGYDDILYDYINGDKTAQDTRDYEDSRLHETHEMWKDLDPTIVGIFNYLYAEDEANGDSKHTTAYEFIDSVVPHQYTAIETGFNRFFENVGLAPLVTGGIALGAAITGDDELKQQNKQAREDWNAMLAQQAQQHPIAATVGGIAGSVALMATARVALSAIATAGSAGAAVADGVQVLGADGAPLRTATHVGVNMIQAAGVSGLTYGLTTAIQQVGDAATGIITPGQYGKNVLVSGVKGFAGNLAKTATLMGAAKLLYKYDMMTPFAHFLRATASEITDAVVGSAIEYIAADEKPTSREIAESLLTSFAFSIFESAISSVKEVEAAREVFREYGRESIMAVVDADEKLKDMYWKIQYNISKEEVVENDKKLAEMAFDLRKQLYGTGYIPGQQKLYDELDFALMYLEDYYKGAASRIAAQTRTYTKTEIKALTSSADMTWEMTQEISEALTQGLTADTAIAPTFAVQPVSATQLAEQVGTLRESVTLPTYEETVSQNGTAIVKNLRDSALMLSEMPVVATAESGEKVTLEDIPATVLREGIGEIEIPADGEVKQPELLPTIPEVLKKGTEIETTDSSQTIAAPVELDTSRVNVAAVVEWDVENKPYLSEAATEKGQIFKAADRTNNVQVENSGRLVLPTAEQDGNGAATNPTIDASTTLSAPQNELTVNSTPVGENITPPAQVQTNEMTLPRGEITTVNTQNGGRINEETGLKNVQRTADGKQITLASEDTVYGGDAGGRPSYADTGRTERIPEGVRGLSKENRELTLQRQRAVEDMPLVSTVDIGIENGTPDAYLRILPEDDWDEELRTLKDWAQSKGIKNVRAVVGTLTVDEGSGPVSVLDVINKETGELVIRADSLSRSATETMVHAVGHYLTDEGMVRQFMETVKSRKPAAWQAMYEKYKERWARLTNYYEDMTDAETELYVWEEIMEDAYANINNYGMRASTFHDEAYGIIEGTETPERGSPVLTGEGATAAAFNDATGPPERYLYAGENAKGANLEALATAKAMEQEGASEKSILALTGWFRGMDGKWEYEIDDSGMEYRRDGDAELLKHTDYQRLEELTKKWADSFENGGTPLSTEEETELQGLQNKYSDEVWNEKYMLRDFLRHDALFEAYPQLNGVSLVFKNLPDGVSGLYDKRSNTIVLSSNLIGSPNKKLVHEIQHVIQKIEGFAGGSSPEYWNRRIEEGYSRKLPAGEEMQPDELYRNTAGEIQARDTAARINLTADERRATMPDLGDENTVFAEGGEWLSASDYDPEAASIKEQIEQSREILNAMPLAASVTVPTNLKKKDEAATWVTKRLKNTGYRVDRQGYGEIYFNKNDIDKGLRYADTEEEKAALAALPQVLKRGIEIGGHESHKNRKKQTITFGALVELNGIRGNMGVVVNKKGNHYYAHRIVLPNGETFKFSVGNENEDATQELSRGVTVSGSLADTTSVASEDKIAGEQDVVKGYFDERGKYVLPKYEAEVERSASQPQAVDSEGIKDITNENSPRNKDMRFSVEDVPETEKAPAKKKKEVKPVAKSLPIIAKKELRETMMSIFSIPPGYKKMLGDVVDRLADKLLETGTLSWEERKKFFDGMYESGVMTVAADEYSNYARDIVLKKKIYVPEEIRHEFGGSEDYNEFKKRAFAAGIYLTSNKDDEHIDVLNMELAELLPGLFDSTDTDGTEILRTIIQVAEEGKAQKISLAEYTAELAGREYVSEDEVLDNLERQMDWALRTFAEKAKLEVKLRDRTGAKLAQQREAFAEMQNKQSEREQAQRIKELDARKAEIQRQRENRELKELQYKTLKNLQWLGKNRNKAPKDLRETWDEVLGDIDIYAIGAANASRWSNKYQATWKDLAQMYKDAQKNDPNFLPSKELERIVARVDNAKIADMDINALNDLYKAAVGLRTEFYNRNRILGDAMNDAVDEVYRRSKGELEFGANGKAGAAARKGGKADKFINMDQLSPMNVLERMAGWNPESSFYNMAKQLEKGEKDIRAYTVKAQKQLKDFLTENADWVKAADGQGKGGVWYELEVPELLELRHGDAPIFGNSVKVYMTPSQKVHMYLESKNYDNLLHMAGGRTFPDRELYSQGKRNEAFAQGKTIRLAPETVKSIVRDLTPEEQELANALEKYYNGFASGEINRVSNILYGYDKAMNSSYAPIYTNSNYTKSEIGVYEATAEGVGNLKARQYSKNPSYNIGAFDAFERHVEQTARFVGMAIPARNWQTLLNWRESANSMKDVISHTWGDASLKYISELIQTLQGGKGLVSDSVSSLTDKIFSNYISAVFGANPSIVFKQLGSIPLASAYLGLENFPSPGQVSRVDRELIGKYTQELDWRTLGYSTPETKQLKENPNWSQSNKVMQFTLGGGAITAMDGWAASVLWPWAENMVRREFPGIEVGTQEEIDNGTSPFYRKVADLFDEAVARSQSTSDEMHQGTLRKSKNPVSKAFTMFKSDSSQTYNAFRQRWGESKYYKSQGDEEKYKKTKRLLGAAVIAAIGGYTFAEVIEFLMNLWKHKGKRYRDEDGELTTESVVKEMAMGLVGDLAGIISGGEELAEIIGNAITGDTWYGIDTPGLEQLTDVIETISKNGQAGYEVLKEAVNVVKNGGNLFEYLRRHGGDITGGIKELAMAAATYLPGLPVNNLEAYILGTVKWIAPSVATAYEDALATAEKSGLKGLTGAALEQRVGDILSTRGVKTEDEVSVALAELYEAGFTDAVPVDTPDTVSVDGENRELDAYQQQTYDAVWSGTVSGAIEELIDSKAYQNADNETRAKMIDSLYEYAGEQAKSVVFGDYEKDASTAHAEDIIGAGASTADWAAWRGKTAGMTDTEKYALLREEDYPDKVKAAIAGSLMGTEIETDSGGLSAYAKMLKALDTGLSMDDYLGLRAEKAVDKYLNAVEYGVKSDTARDLALSLVGLEPQDGKKGVSEAQKWRAAIDVGENKDEQREALKAVMSESALEKYEIADSYGVSPTAYVTLKETLPNYDFDGNGRYKQEEITAAIDSMGGGGGLVLPGGSGNTKLTLEQQAVLWQLYTGADSAKNNPYSTQIGWQVIKARENETESTKLVLPE